MKHSRPHVCVNFYSLILNLFSFKSGEKTKFSLCYAILRLFLQFKNTNVGVRISKESDMEQRVKKLTFKTFKK